MPVSVDITDPVSNQTVGTNVTVLGSYSGADGSPFVILCQMCNPALNVNEVKLAMLDTQEGTWEASFSGLPVSTGAGGGSYTVSAWAATAVPQVLPACPVPIDSGALSEPVLKANPVFGVEVSADPLIWLDTPPAVAGVRETAANKTVLVTVTGKYRDGHGLANGYVVTAYSTRCGAPASTQGRLRTMSHGCWEYTLRIPAKGTCATLHVELCRANACDGAGPPLAKLVARIVV